MSDLATRVHKKLVEYLAGDITLSAFQDWLRPNLWEVGEADRSLKNLAYGIELCLSEFEHGDWTEPELREKLQSTEKPQPSACSSANITRLSKE